MPGLYTPPDYDLAGFIVGCVEEDARARQPTACVTGTCWLGWRARGSTPTATRWRAGSSAERLALGPHDAFPGRAAASVADVLLRVHRSYLAALAVRCCDHVHAMAHITGGGIPGQPQPRAAADARCGGRHVDAGTCPDVFRVLEEAGEVPRDEMFRAFNMGVGMIVVTSASGAEAIVASAAAAGVNAWRLGRVQPGSGRVTLR